MFRIMPSITRRIGVAGSMTFERLETALADKIIAVVIAFITGGLTVYSFDRNTIIPIGVWVSAIVLIVAAYVGWMNWLSRQL
jgi:hypothetical protein